MTIEIYNLGLGDCNDIGNDMLLYGDEAFKILGKCFEIFGRDAAARYDDILETVLSQPRQYKMAMYMMMIVMMNHDDYDDDHHNHFQSAPAVQDGQVLR